MATIVRYQNILKGEINITGNTLGLAGDQFGDGVLNFTTSTPPPPSGGKTTTWQDNGSSAYLVLPQGAKVAYAELTWAAMYNNSIVNDLNSTITFTSPLGSNQVAGDPITSEEIITQVGETFYKRSQNVTNIVKAAGAGLYTVSGVPGIIQGGNDYIGWCLITAYSLNSAPRREIVIWTLIDHIQGSFGDVVVPITGFITPSSGAVNGRLVVCAGGGNPELTGDFMKFGPTTLSAATLSGPNNSATNFFASQINDNAGFLNTTGTWGTMNSVPPNNAKTGDRNSFDITNVDVSPGLTNNQTSAQIIFGTTNDTYDALALGIQIDINSPNINTIKSVDKSTALPGEVLSYTLVIENTGSLNADSAILMDTIPDGTTFNTGSLFLNGAPVSGTLSPPGINLGTIPVNSISTLTFSVTIESTIPSAPIAFENYFDLFYNFSVFTTPQSAVDISNIVITTIPSPDLRNITKKVNKSYATIGDILVYTITIPNNGDTDAINVIFKDSIPSGTSFLNNSFVFNNTSIPSANPTAGVNLGTISKGTVSTITFNTTVTTIPKPNPILNQANASYNAFSSTIINNSNSVTTYVNFADLSGITKSVSSNYSTCGDTLVYSITIPNAGNITATNIKLFDTIPNGTSFVPGSLIINGVSQPSVLTWTNVTIPDIAPSSASSISFSVKINC